MTRIALAQVNATVGDFPGNLARMRAAWESAREAGSHLVLFPELAIPGYHARDLFNRRDFLKANLRSLEEMAGWTTDGPALLVGACDFDATKSTPGGRPLRYNAAAFAAGGKVERMVHKTLLPTYDVFDESRYFRPARRHPLVAFRDLLLGVTICEDLWDEHYVDKPSDVLGAMGAQVLLNLSASPFHDKKHGLRREVFSEQARRHKVPVLVCNLVGAQDELVFDGSSLVVSADGEIVAEGALFEEDLLLVDLGDKGVRAQGHAPQPVKGREETLFGAAVLGVRDYFAKTGFSNAILGLSGGVDSALVAAIAAEALGPDSVMPFYMPYAYSSDLSGRLAREVAEVLGLDLQVLPIHEAVDQARGLFESAVGPVRRLVTNENLQARVRGVFLMQVSNDRGALVLASGNKTELALGYATLYGDMCGALAPISDLNKLEVFRLARWLAEAGRLPLEVVERVPTAELAPDQVDPFDYEVVAPLAEAYVSGRATLEELAEQYPPDLVQDVARRVRLAEFKRRQMPMGLKLTEKAFGMGRRYPIAQRYTEEGT